MKSSIVKRSVVVGGHKTSVSLEDAFWRQLKEIAASRRVSLRDLIARIDTDREHGNLSSAIRLFVLNHCQAARRHLIEASWQPINIMPRTDSAVGVDR